MCRCSVSLCFKQKVLPEPLLSGVLLNRGSTKTSICFLFEITFFSLHDFPYIPGSRVQSTIGTQKLRIYRGTPLENRNLSQQKTLKQNKLYNGKYEDIDGNIFIFSIKHTSQTLRLHLVRKLGGCPFRQARYIPHALKLSFIFRKQHFSTYDSLTTFILFRAFQ